MSYSRLLLLPLLAAALLAPIRATTVPEMSFEEVVASSAAIVHGKVVRSWTSWDPERTAIWTHYAIQVKTQLKGGPGTVVTISEPGGELDGKHMLIAGAPRYEVGEEVVVFASETPIGYLRTCGWGQGKFEVRRTAPGERAVVRASPLGVRLLAAKDGDSAPAAALDGSQLEPFFSRVREVMAAQRARGER
jgi:hypothetical protein